MSVNGIERAIWLATTSDDARAAYLADMGEYLNRFRITAEERELLLSWKLKALIAHGVNPGLLLGAFSAIHGRGKRTEYLQVMAENE
ncbi:hypothetical protein [Novosphingobium pentaromativorans]|uniref:Extradiol ring-cleavage dioxygenase LigAB LigA subunit domain-containing protein n=1 Tax=Novosphingobium pentaromativorans US6-1 TaxID=1088721 RepID=G6EGL9_9SPHN|nr:hypothetical protein [Novosphingobium pentaromativorans]AIT82155.1 hypothetical protein JI59_21755 [Novosphingobium pentaromativorans US6-1]EHJ59566.1 hypothetical protein NSU_3449 [Novosphingobium pentaromativorans US6-1]